MTERNKSVDCTTVLEDLLHRLVEEAPRFGSFSICAHFVEGRLDRTEVSISRSEKVAFR